MLRLSALLKPLQPCSHRGLSLAIVNSTTRRSTIMMLRDEKKFQGRRSVFSASGTDPPRPASGSAADDPYELLTPEEKRLVDAQLEQMKIGEQELWRKQVRSSDLTRFTKLVVVLVILIISISLQSLTWRKDISTLALKLRGEKDDAEEKHRRLSAVVTEEDVKAQVKKIAEKIHIYTGLEDERELQRLSNQLADYLQYENTPQQLQRKRDALHAKRLRQKEEEQELVQALSGALPANS